MARTRHVIVERQGVGLRVQAHGPSAQILLNAQGAQAGRVGRIDV